MEIYVVLPYYLHEGFGYPMKAFFKFEDATGFVDSIKEWKSRKPAAFSDEYDTWLDEERFSLVPHYADNYEIEAVAVE